MTGKIFKHAFFLGVIVLILCAVLFFGVQYAQTKEETYSALRQDAVYASNGVMLAGEEYLRTLNNRDRITWIAADGQVLYDSESGASISNQTDYAEVAEAMAEGEGHGIRKSETDGVQMMYYALRCEDGTVLRLSKPISAVRNALAAVSPVLWIFVLVLLISGMLASRAAKQLIDPINEIDLDEPDPSKIYRELAPLIGRIREQKLTIRDQMDELHRKQREFSALTDNMSEGFVLLDRAGTVLSANSAAARLIEGCEPGYNMTGASDGTVASSVESALSGERSDKIIPCGERSVQFIFNPVMSHGKPSGAVVLAMDVTEREQREQLRREFSSNVSHELKTPLTSISGFAELIMQDMVPKEKVKEFSGDIYRESQRLITLVNDIIKLSKLDDEDVVPELETVDLYSVAEDVVDSLRAAADKRKVAVTLSGESSVMQGVVRYLDEIVYNLCDNAIKYNKDGGAVSVSVKNGDDNVTLTVSDTGIGIPYEHQDRVFERFYRVNKSHSKEVSGTGLGLSIVKHAARFHSAKISLDSKPGEGTSVTVVFPKNVNLRRDAG